MWSAIKAEKFELLILLSIILVGILIVVVNTHQNAQFDYQNKIFKDQFDKQNKAFNQSKINFKFLAETNKEVELLNDDHQNLSQEIQQIETLINKSNNDNNNNSNGK